MHRSLNEIEQTVRKAVRGCGYPWGVADEAGKAARALHEYRIDGVDLVACALDLFGYDGPPGQAPVALTGTWRARSGRLDPLLAGPSLRDSLGCTVTDTLELSDVAYPGLLAGYLAMVARESHARIALGWDGITVVMDGQRLGLVGDRERLYAAECEMAQCNRGGDSAVEQWMRPRVGEVPVDDNAWKAVERYAHRTYVQATEASRMAGAGAGLVDND